jgi:hypothetical protein
MEMDVIGQEEVGRKENAGGRVVVFVWMMLEEMMDLKLH